MHSRISVTLAMVVTAATVVASQAPAPPPQQPATATDQTPSFRSGIEVVSVDVGVVDKQGQPLRGLTPADFVVTVAGRPRRVVTAEFVERPAPLPVPATAAPPEPDRISTNEGGGAGRLYAFIVDQNTLDLGSARRVATATTPFFSRPTFADRSALLLMPLGPNVSFTGPTTACAKGSSASPAPATEHGLGIRQPRRSAGHLEPQPVRAAQPGRPRMRVHIRVWRRRRVVAVRSRIGRGRPDGTPAPPAGGMTTGAKAAAAAYTDAADGNGADRRGHRCESAGQQQPECVRRQPARAMQMQAESAWRTAQMNSLASLSTLRQALAALGRVRGDKTVILISGGWPLDDREEMSAISTVASEAAAARVTLYSIFVPPPSFSADRRMLTSTPLADTYLYSGPLETLAGMTGGASFRAEVGADAAFERLARELAGYYRIGVERDPSDSDGKGRRLKVQVARDSLTVRAREIFDVRTYEDRDWAARLASAIDAPVPATDIGLRVTSYLSADPDDGSRRRVLFAGEVPAPSLVTPRCTC